MVLSIIVPVYNVETYLQKCVDSLLNQDLPATDYEIILIDDGSTDNSGQLCDILAAGGSNIHVIHQPNKGLGAARNTGIATASGKYIQFVDSDDYLCPNVLGGIVRQLENQSLDILRINYQNVKTDGEAFEPNKYSKPFDDYSEEVCSGLTFLNERLGFACYAVQFVCRAPLLKQDGNGFKEGIYFEDTEWAPRIILQAKRITSFKTIAYNYLYRHESISRNTSLERRRKSISDKLELTKSLKQLGNKVVVNHWFQGMISQTVLSIIVDVSRFDFQNRREYLDLLITMNVFPLSSFHATPSAKKKIKLANISPQLLCLICHFKEWK